MIKYGKINFSVLFALIAMPGCRIRENRIDFNWRESSYTAMFGYALARGINIVLINAAIYRPVVDRAYNGILRYSLVNLDRDYTTLKNVCAGTCIGDRNYYFKREVREGTPFGLGACIMFGLAYRDL